MPRRSSSGPHGPDPASIARFAFLALASSLATIQPALGQPDTIPLVHRHFVWEEATRTFSTISQEHTGDLPADQALASAAEIMTRPAMGGLEDGYRLCTLPLRYTVVFPYQGSAGNWTFTPLDWRMLTVPAPPEPYPAFVRQMPGVAADYGFSSGEYGPEGGVVFANDEVEVLKIDQGWWRHVHYRGQLDGELWQQIINVPVAYSPYARLLFRGGWTIEVMDGYPSEHWVNDTEESEYPWSAQVTFISPDGDVSTWDEFHLTQAQGTQQQELTAAGTYTFTIQAYGESPQINVHLYRERLWSGMVPPSANSSVLTDLMFETDGSWRITFGRNGEVRVKAEDWRPAAHALVAYTCDVAGPEAMGPSRLYAEEAERRFDALTGKFCVHDFDDDELLVDFGRVALGESWTMPLYFFNGGEQEVGALGLGSPDHAAFALVGDPPSNAALPPEGWVVHDVRFEPAEAGDFDATLTTGVGLTIRLAGQGFLLTGDPAPGIPTALAIGGVVPNPFNTGTTIFMDLPRPGIVSLSVLDLCGRKVRTLWDGHAEAGRHPVAWNGLDDRGMQRASGVYLVRLAAADGQQRAVKMTLAK